jgi:hypothetical protein
MYRGRRQRIINELGMVPAYAGVGADVEPVRERTRKRTGRLTQPDQETVSSAEFEQMKRDITEEEAEPSRHTSTLTKRLAHTEETEPVKRSTDTARKAKPRPAAPKADEQQADTASETNGSTVAPDGNGAGGGDGDGFVRAPDEAENEGVAPVQKSSRQAKSRSRNRRHGRRR